MVEKMGKKTAKKNVNWVRTTQTAPIEKIEKYFVG
jgi:hypothetical protein